MNGDTMTAPSDTRIVDANPAAKPEDATYAWHYQLMRLSIYIILLLVQIALALTPAHGAVDRWLLHVYTMVGIGLLVTCRLRWFMCLQWLHITFTMGFVMTPFLAHAPPLLAVHLILVLSTLALRAECDGKCVINTMECDSEKVYDESLVDRLINFNVLFWLSGAATLVKWLFVCGATLSSRRCVDQACARDFDEENARLATPRRGAAALLLAPDLSDARSTFATPVSPVP